MTTTAEAIHARQEIRRARAAEALKPKAKKKAKKEKAVAQVEPAGELQGEEGAAVQGEGEGSSLPAEGEAE